jgi:hypothetical protein
MMAAKKPKLISRIPSRSGCARDPAKMSETERAIFNFLTGKLKRKSEQEQEARLAIADMLYEGSLPQYLLHMLANRFCPNMILTEYQFVLEPRPGRTRGRPKVQSWEVAEIVDRRIRCGDKKEAAYQFAVEKLGVSKRTAEKAYAECKEKILRIKAMGPGVRLITRLDK